MGRYYNFDKESYHQIREEESIYGQFADNEPNHVRRALKRNNLHQAVCNSDYDEAAALVLASKDSVNQQDIHGNTALHLAIVNQESFPEIYERIIRLLVTNGAKRSIKNIYGDTPDSLAKTIPMTREKLAIMFDLPPLNEFAKLRTINH